MTLKKTIMGQMAAKPPSMVRYLNLAKNIDQQPSNMNGIASGRRMTTLKLNFRKESIYGADKKQPNLLD
jgi:hypothetical protein